MLIKNGILLILNPSKSDKSNSNNNVYNDCKFSNKYNKANY